MPAIRPTPSNKQTLRQKRHVGLKVCTAIAPDVNVVVEGADGAAERGRRIQRGFGLAMRRGVPGFPGIKASRGSTKEGAARKENVNPFRKPMLPPTTIPSKPIDDPERTPVPIPEQKDYHEIVPGLFVVVSSISCDSKLPKSFKGDFTHVVRVSQAAKCDSWTESDDISSIQILNLTTPTTTPPCGPVRMTKSGRRVRNLIPPQISKDQEGTTQLTISQLQIARDFLSLSLPYFSLSNPPSPSIPQYSSTSQAKVLIVAPKHVDALSIVVAYLAFCSGEHVFTVIQYIDEDRGVPRGWRGVFPVDSMLSVGREMWYGEGAEKVEWAARLDG